MNEKWHSENKANIQHEAECIVITAAKIIRVENRDKAHSSDLYPTNDDISNIETS